MADLSPAAREILIAYWEAEEVSQQNGVAAALRAVADQVQMDKPLGGTDADAGVFAAHHAISAHLLAIAAELEQ